VRDSPHGLGELTTKRRVGKMEVWFISAEKFEKVQTDHISTEWIRRTMRKLGLKKARVVAWHPGRADPDDWGVFELTEEEGRQ